MLHGPWIPISIWMCVKNQRGNKFRQVTLIYSNYFYTFRRSLYYFWSYNKAVLTQTWQETAGNLCNKLDHITWSFVYNLLNFFNETSSEHISYFEYLKNSAVYKVKKSINWFYALVCYEFLFFKHEWAQNDFLILKWPCLPGINSTYLKKYEGEKYIC